MKTYPLAVISPFFKAALRNFCLKHMTALMPGRTIVVTRKVVPQIENYQISFPYLELGAKRYDVQWLTGSLQYLLNIKKLSPVKSKVANFLQKHSVKVILCEYLNESVK